MRHQPAKRTTGRAQTTRQLSDEHEDFVAEVLDGRRSSNSGAVANDPLDVVTSTHVIECKATEGKSVSLKRDDWLGIRSKVYGLRKPLMAYRFRDPYTKKHIDLVMVELDEFSTLLQDRANLLDEVDRLKEYVYTIQGPM